ncbi:MAG: threonine/homoserine/homoserine lactone efflux protein [Candidatus Azotimanducaceae bacterium]|jgi:threonine/homoserine/homoserine lactone efflux protein
MPITDSLSYFITLVAIAIAPGPVVLMLMARAASNDVKGAAGFGFGFAMGGVAIISAVCFGMSAWLTAVPEVLNYSKYIMIGYIVWMARGIWKGGFDLNKDGDAKRQSILTSIGAGIITCMISPYMMILFPLVLPEMMDITVIRMPDFLIVAVITFLALACGAALIVGFAAQLRRIAKSPRATLIMNRSLATILVMVGGGMTLV